MLGHPENLEEPVGTRLLEFYICHYLYDTPDHLGIQDKTALRLCCKRFKALFDAAITGFHEHLTMRGRVTYFSSEKELITFDSRMTDEAIPESFNSLDLICQMFPSLKELDFLGREPGSDTLPDSIGKLTSLTSLQLSIEFGGVYRALPSSISQLTALKDLTVHMKAITDESIAPLKHCTGLEHLYLVLSGITSNYKVPGLLGTFNSLTDLSFTAKGDGDCLLPDSIGNLKQLERFYLNGYCNIDIPASFGDMCSLTYLSLYGIRGLKCLPESLGNLSALEDLTMESCGDLESWPDSFGALQTLKYLRLNRCIKLSNLPSCIGDVQSLSLVFIEQCFMLTALPDSIGDLKSLTLKLANCDVLHSLPESLYRCTALKNLWIFNCEQLTTPTAETLLQHYGKALSYQNERLRIEKGVISRW